MGVAWFKPLIAFAYPQKNFLNGKILPTAMVSVASQL